LDNFFVTEYFDWKPQPLSRRVRIINAILAKLGFWSRLAPPPFTGLMTNVEKRMNMFHLASQVLAYGVRGDLVEVGCHNGQSCVLLRKVIDYYDSSRALHAYDSFQGLPERRAEDRDSYSGFAKGGLRASQERLLDNFRSLGLKPPEIHAGWFKDTLPTQLPDRICFAHLDGDFYDSILTSLEHVYPRLSKGAVCLIDDYCDPAVNKGWSKLPGVKRACDEFLADKPERVSGLYAGDYSHGYFRRV